MLRKYSYTDLNSLFSKQTTSHQIYLILAFIFFISNAYSQSFLNESCSWKSKELKYDDLYFLNLDYEDYIEGDTIIEDLNYFKVYRRGTLITGFSPTDTMNISEIFTYKGAIREDDKIWYWIEKDSVDQVELYDFNLQDGDSIMITEQSLKYELTLVDSAYIDETYKKIYNLDGLPILLIEDIGWNTGPINPVTDFLGLFTFTYLQCFHRNDEKWSPNLAILETITNTTLETIEDCQSEITALNHQFLTKKLFKNDLFDFG